MTFRTFLFLLKVSARQKISGMLKHVTPFPFPLRLGFAVIPRNTFFRNRRQRGRAVRALGPLIGPALTRLWLNLFSVAWPRVFKRWIALSTGYIKIYPLDNAIGFPNTYPGDSDLSGW